MVKRKDIKIDSKVHKRLKEKCEFFGMKVGDVASKVLSDYCDKLDDIKNNERHMSLIKRLYVKKEDDENG